MDLWLNSSYYLIDFQQILLWKLPSNSLLFYKQICLLRWGQTNFLHLFHIKICFFLLLSTLVTWGSLFVNYVFRRASKNMTINDTSVWWNLFMVGCLIMNTSALVQKAVFDKVKNHILFFPQIRTCFLYTFMFFCFANFTIWLIREWLIENLMIFYSKF